MGKPTAKKKRSLSIKSNNGNSKSNRSAEQSPKVFDADAALFTDMANDLKEEGNRLFQKRDYDGAFVKYEKAIKLIPKKHVDLACLHSNIAACYMQMGPEYYHKAIHECNLALEVSPKYTKALLKRARCFEALNRMELAIKDVDSVLTLEPSNLTALELSDSIKTALDVKGIQLNNNELVSHPDNITALEKPKKKKRNKIVDKVVVEDKILLETALSDEPTVDAEKAPIVDAEKAPIVVAEKAPTVVAEKAPTVVAEKVPTVVAEKVPTVVAEMPNVSKEEPMKGVKLVFGDDIRFAQLPKNCSMSQLREIVRSRFPGLKAVLIKYRDRECDLVTITTSEELRWAEDSADPQGSIRLYINEVKPELEPFFNDGNKGYEEQGSEKNLNGDQSNRDLGFIEVQDNLCCINEWIVEFAQLFKSHVGVDSDAYLNLHQLGMKLYSEAMEDTVTSEEAMEVFDLASVKFQEMAALALFNLGNVFMSRARKRIFLVENDSKESVLAQIKSSYEWAKEEYKKAGSSYEEAMKIKPDFYEGLLALAHQQFELAKLTWYFAFGNKIDLDTWPSKEVLELFNNAEEYMERGTETWRELEEQSLKARLKPNKEKVILEKMGLGQFIKQFSADKAAESSANMSSQVHILWGRILYERSIVEFKLSFPTWEDCLMAAIEKFKLAGTSPTDIAVMIKNHCANETNQEGLGFKIDEIVQAWNEMYEAKRWMHDFPSFRLEPLFRRRVPKLHQSLEYA